MTEVGFEKLEQQMLRVLADYDKKRNEVEDKCSEIEQLRAEMQRLSSEIVTLKQERDETTHKLQRLYDMLKSVGEPTASVEPAMVSPTLLAVKPVLVQG